MTSAIAPHTKKCVWVLFGSHNGTIHRFHDGYNSDINCAIYVNVPENNLLLNAPWILLQFRPCGHFYFHLQSWTFCGSVSRLNAERGPVHCAEKRQQFNENFLSKSWNLPHYFPAKGGQRLKQAVCYFCLLRNDVGIKLIYDSLCCLE